MTAPVIVPGPVGLPAPAGPGTRTCTICGNADRILIDAGGVWVCLNIDRCKP